MAVKKNPFRKNAKAWDKEKVLDYVFQKIATSSLGIESIVKSAQYDLPTRQTIMEWKAADEDIADKYARAKESQADFLGEEILTIADDASNDYMTVTRGEVDVDIIDHEHVQRSKLRIESRKWLMGKLRPKQYGDKVSLDHSSPDGSMSPKPAIDASQLSTDALKEVMALHDSSTKQ